MRNAKIAAAKTPEICPVCGEDVPRGSLACPECGADHNSGWREDAGTYDSVDLPEDDFKYDEFVRAEFGGSSPESSPLRMVWWLTAVILLAILVAAYFYANR